MAGSKCPWYMNKVCYSPKTISEYGSPSPIPVSNGYCLSDNYRECPYYVESSEEGEKGEGFLKSLGIEVKEGYYQPIHVIPCNTRSECPFFKLRKENGICIAYCAATERYITKSKVWKCVELWKNCPFYKIGLEVLKT